MSIEHFILIVTFVGMIGVLSLVATHIVYKNVNIWSLIKYPDSRSSHTKPTPTAGGLGVVASVSVALLNLILNAEWNFGWVVFLLSLVIAVAGLLDDIKNLSPKIRFSVQTVVCSIFVICISGMPVLRFLFIPFSGFLLSLILIVAGVWWINLFNFMDGIDGISGSQVVFMLTSACVLMFVNDLSVYNDILFILTTCVVAACVGFLIMNWSPARIFMGDVGSTYLGFIIFAIFMIAIKNGFLSYESCFILSGSFIADATVTLVVRLLRGECIYAAHRSHAYQRLSRIIGDHSSVVMFWMFINVFWLFPMSMACAVWESMSLLFVIIAYAPLVWGAVAIGAGRPDND